MGFLDDLASEKRRQENELRKRRQMLEHALRESRRTLESLLAEVANNTWGPRGNAILFGNEKWRIPEWGRGIDLEDGYFYIEVCGNFVQQRRDAVPHQLRRLTYQAFRLTVYVNDRGEHARATVRHKDGLSECEVAGPALETTLREAFSAGPFRGVTGWE